jgi:hypothetical protein
MGIKIPTTIQSQIDAFLNGGTGINPYDPDQIRIECNYNSGAYKRYGFYYRDFTTQNNEWIENANDYKFRVRIAPPQVGSNMAEINLIVNGIIVETITRFFEVIDSNNPGHLKMANGNLMKLQHENGKMFFGVGQNIAFANPSIRPNCSSFDCISPFSFNEQRSYISDLAINGGNFMRFRLDALNMLCEWPYKKFLTSDPAPNPSRPLSSFLTNFDHNQRYLWETDKTFSLMENNGVYGILNLLPDQDFSPDGGYDKDHNYTWNNNPYNTITGNDLAGCKAFFSNPQSMATYRKWLYYLMARYGYSTSLGVWEMINETVNVANTYSDPHLIDHDATFNSQVKNWICDMKYYLQQQYPWHPASTGFVSTVNATNIAYNCLNIWSSNSYVTNIEHNIYSDQDYDNRTKALIGANSALVAPYFYNYKPFFWGELGIADGANFIDELSDRPFHNAIWASAMSGCISNGMYWNDWFEKRGTPHRQNFQALRAFTDRIDFTQRLEPHEEKDVNSGREIHTWWMNNGAKNYIVGWAKNNSANWTQDLQYFPTSPLNYQDSALLETSFNNNVLQYACFNSINNPYITLRNLLGLTKYKITIYEAYGAGNQLDQFNKTTGFAGTLSFRRFMPSTISPPDYPDYAFIIETYYSNRFSNNNKAIYDTLSLSEADTICFNNTSIPNYNNYDINWDFGNNHVSNDSINCINYKSEGNYEVTITANHKENDSIIVFKHYITVTNNLLAQKIQNISAFPTPANNFVTLDYNDNEIINPAIELYDVLGKKQTIVFLNYRTINTTNLADGIYFIKFTYETIQKTIKFTIQH